MKGKFVTLEGIDGSGKSTLARMLANHLNESGIDVELTAEPTQGPYGQIIRKATKRFGVQDEIELFARDRDDHLTTTIAPALERGATVICDRYIHSSLAYQGARGVSFEKILDAQSDSLIYPDLVIMLDIQVDLAYERLQKTRKNGLTQFETIDGLKRVKELYDGMDDEKIHRIDAAQNLDEVFLQAANMVKSL